MDPLLGWFITQALGPHVVAKAWDLATSKDDKTRLAKESARATKARGSWRRIRRWLDRPETWPDLVEPSRPGGERLVASLMEYLRPRIVLRRGRHSPEQRRRLAEALVGEVGARFLQTLDPSLAVAIAHYRDMRLLTTIHDHTTELVTVSRVRQDKQERLARLPSAIAGYVETLLGTDESSGFHLLDALTEPDIEPSRIVPELIVEPPPWLGRLPPVA